MVEPVDASHKRVTFLWRGARDNVYILGSPAGDHDPLFRLGKSDVWFRSYVVPADTVMQYKMAPDVPVIDGPARPAARHSGERSGRSAQPKYLWRTEDRSLEPLLAARSQPARYCTVQATAQPLVHGTLSRQNMASKILGNSREVMIYKPRGAQPARWTLILFDGQVYQDEYHFANVLDGLIARHHLPPVNVVFIDSLDHARRGKELPPNPDFADFMAHELLPWLRGQGIALQRKKRCWQVLAMAVSPHPGWRCDIHACSAMCLACRDRTGGHRKGSARLAYAAVPAGAAVSGTLLATGREV
jgi:enterochelin esterase family protein